MKIAIAGAGAAGSYCARRLLAGGYDIDLYDLPHKNVCGIAPCAWMTTADIAPLLAGVGLDYQDYVLRSFSTVRFEDCDLPAVLMTIDKPRLLSDLRRGMAVLDGSPDLSRYDRVIDATGTARAFLPPIADDHLCRCVQVRMPVLPSLPPVPSVRYVTGGYAWSFPLEGGLRHVGCLSHLTDPADLLKGCGFLEDAAGPVICGCRSLLRVTAPSGALPCVSSDRKIWGIGEAIGCVYPIVGDGIVPAFESVRLLLDHLEDPEAYTAAVPAAFPQMEAERDLLLTLKAGKIPGSGQLLRMRDQTRLGIRIGVAEVARVLAGVLARTQEHGYTKDRAGHGPVH
ncbi:MAG: hypothetical protein PWP08_338 [Methanofollis sp.]|nr:hypothetical protein [Methanofollis sp.]